MYDVREEDKGKVVLSIAKEIVDRDKVHCNCGIHVGIGIPCIHIMKVLELRHELKPENLKIYVRNEYRI